MSRVVAVVVLAYVTFGPALPLNAAEDGPWFVDEVPFGSVYYDYVGLLAEANVLQGYPDGTLCLDRIMTRYEFACAWARLLETKKVLQEPRSLSHVTMDVPPDHWARSSVEKLFSAGLIGASHFKDADALLLGGTDPDRLCGGHTGYLNFHGDRPLLRRELPPFVVRTEILSSKRLASDVEAGRFPRLHDKLPSIRSGISNMERTSPIEAALDGLLLFIGYPDGTIRLDEPFTLGEFCFALGRWLGTFWTIG